MKIDEEKFREWLAAGNLPKCGSIEGCAVCWSSNPIPQPFMTGPKPMPHVWLQDGCVETFWAPLRAAFEKEAAA